MSVVESLKQGIKSVGESVRKVGKKAGSAGKKVKSGAKKAAKATVGKGEGRISVIEFFIGAVIYTVTALTCFGFGSPDIAVFRDFAPLTLIIGALLVYGADKESITDTSLIEIAFLTGSIVLPLMAAGKLPWIDQYLNISSLDVPSAFLVFMGSVLMLIFAARLD